MIEITKVMEDIPRYIPLTWRSFKLDGVLRVRLMCSNGHEVLLDHEIDVNGIVTPSVVCPINRCNFHEHVSLKDWESLG